MTVFTDTGTLSSKTALSAVEVEASVDAATFATVSTPTGFEQLWRDSAIFATVTSIPVGEVDYVHPSGSWGTFDLDDGII